MSDKPDPTKPGPPERLAFQWDSLAFGAAEDLRRLATAAEHLVRLGQEALAHLRGAR